MSEHQNNRIGVLKIKIWLSKNSEVSVRQQIIAQISLGITSGDLKAGEKLPSTRELARRFQIHQNTISNAYRELAERNLVEVKKGSGVYVRENLNADVGADALDYLINRFFREAAAKGFSSAETKARLKKRLAANTLKTFLVVESDAELRKILVEEVRSAIGGTIDSTSFETLSNESVDDEARILLIFDKASSAFQTLPSNKMCVFLKPNSVPDSMTGKARPSESDLIAVVSGWEKFLELAKMFLLAARIAPEILILRSTNQPDWRNGLQNASLIICDSATAKNFPGDERVRIFQTLADSSLKEIDELSR